jgi:hypothetical protein
MMTGVTAVENDSWRLVIEKDYQSRMDNVNRIQRRKKEMNNGIIASRIDTIKDDKLILSKREVTRNEKN